MNIIRVFPYSAAQLAANDQYKRIFSTKDGEMTVARRLLSGACAGMTATALTHPLDTVRLRLALPGHAYNGACPVSCDKRSPSMPGPAKQLREGRVRPPGPLLLCAPQVWCMPSSRWSRRKAWARSTRAWLPPSSASRPMPRSTLRRTTC